MPSRLNNKQSKRGTPLAERLWDSFADLLGVIHCFIAKVLTHALGWLWRKQGATPLRLRFCVAFLLLGLASLFMAVLMPSSLSKVVSKTQEHSIVQTVDGSSTNSVAKIADSASTNAIASILSKPSDNGLYIRLNEFDPSQVRYLEKAGELSTGSFVSLVALLSAFLAFLCVLFAWFRKPFALWLMKVAWALHAVVLVLVTRWLFVVPSVLNNSDYKAFPHEYRNELWTWPIFGFPLACVLPIIVLLALLTIRTRRYYGGKVVSGRFDSSVIIEDLRTGGIDPRFRSSLYWAINLFLIVLIAPFLIHGCGTEEYGLVKGSGEPAVTEVVRIKPKPKKKQKKLLVDPWSPYILERMDIDDAKVLDELQQETRDTYQANRASKGKLGKGGKGKGGWPSGMEGAKVRFIRLKYSGGNWDQEMGKSGDYNLLLRFNQLTGLPIATETEAREISRLAHFAKKKAPPFVFMTGSQGIRISQREAKILREYCENEGGMLFIDCGGGNFGWSVRQMLSRVFPGKSLVDIPNVDPIYQAPYIFPDGAPRFWHHDGNRALGIRHEGRLVVFYHPGDVKDAWKDGHSGVKPEIADQAYKLGVNVIYYAFNQYYRRHYEQENGE